MAPVAKKLDPVTLSLRNAPVDDEPLTEEEIKDIEASEEDHRQLRTRCRLGNHQRCRRWWR